MLQSHVFQTGILSHTCILPPHSVVYKGVSYHSRVSDVRMYAYSVKISKTQLTPIIKVVQKVSGNNILGVTQIKAEIRRLECIRSKDLFNSRRSIS